MKHAKSITSIAKTRKRLYDLQAWAPYVTFTLPFLDESFQDAVSVRNCVWQTEIPREWFEYLRLHSHTQRGLGGEVAWAWRQLHKITRDLDCFDFLSYYDPRFLGPRWRLES